MRVYIPFRDGSSVSFDGETFTIHKQPKDINAIEEGDIQAPSEAEIAWRNRWNDLVKALENAWKKQKNLKKIQSRKKIYAP